MNMQDRLTRYVCAALKPLNASDINRLNDVDRALTAQVWAVHADPGQPDDDPPPTIATCPQCRALFPRGETCPGCGTDAQAIPGHPFPDDTDPEEPTEK